MSWVLELQGTHSCWFPHNKSFIKQINTVFHSPSDYHRGKMIIKHSKERQGKRLCIMTFNNIRCRVSTKTQKGEQKTILSAFRKWSLNDWKTYCGDNSLVWCGNEHWHRRIYIIFNFRYLIRPIINRL